MLKNILSYGPRQCGTVVVKAGSARSPAGRSPALLTYRTCGCAEPPRPLIRSPLFVTRTLPLPLFPRAPVSATFPSYPNQLVNMQTSFKKTKRKQKKSPLITCYISLLPLKIALQKNRPSVPPRPRPGAPRTHVRELPSSGWPASCFSPSPASQSLLVSLSVLVTRVCVPCVSATPSRLSGLLSSSPPSP